MTETMKNGHEQRDVGERILAMREAKGWSRREMAEKSGVNERTIMSVEKGEHAPLGSTLRRLNLALAEPGAAQDGFVLVERTVVTTEVWRAVAPDPEGCGDAGAE